MSKPSIDQIGRVPMPPRIPTVAEAYKTQELLIEFNDKSYVTYVFESNELQLFKNAKEYEDFWGIGAIEDHEVDTELTLRLHRRFPEINKVYTIDL